MAVVMLALLVWTESVHGSVRQRKILASGISLKIQECAVRKGKTIFDHEKM